MNKGFIRFIAGAVCPKCGCQDAIRAERDEARYAMLRECVECGFTDVLYDAPQTEIPTRVSEPNPLDQIEAQPVRIMDPSIKH